MNNSINSVSAGFTLLEILVAVFIMSFGFLALSQMEYLSVRQKQSAEEGSNATNIIQFVADRDLAELKRVSLLNSLTFIDELKGRTADYTYCDGSSGSSICSSCPCNPLEQITPDPTDGSTDTQCAAISLDDSDILNLLFTTDQTVCLSDYKALGSDAFFLIKQANTSVATGTSTVFTVNLTYAAKSLEQFYDSGFSLAPRDNLAVQGLIVTAQAEDYSDTVPISSGAWGSVLVPHVP